MREFQIEYKVRGSDVIGEGLSTCAHSALADQLLPVRLPASFKGQRSLPGYFWMSRMNCLLMYESKLEMRTLLALDFNTFVEHVVPQPFVLHFTDGHKKYRHIPDFFVRYKNGAGEVINVKPKKYVHTDRNQRAFAACRSASAEMGFGYTTRCEPDPILLANLWWLSGYRRSPARLEECSPFLIDCAELNLTIGEIIAKSTLPALVRPVLFYLLWNRILDVDMRQLLSSDSKIQLPKESPHVH